MTTNEEKIHKESKQLPQIEKKQSNQSEHEQQSSPKDDNNVLPLTHEKKKRKYRKKLRKHSPEYYEQIRIKKMNRKLQQKWDLHFTNDQIPDIFQKKKVNRKTLSKLVNTVNEKRSSTALNSRMPPNKTGQLGVKKQTLPLPKINIANKRSKSFNIHVVSHKQSQLLQIKKKQDPKALIETKLSQKTGKKRSRRPSHQQQTQTDQKVNTEDYKKTLNSLFEQKKFLNSHKQTIEIFFQKLTKKRVKQMIDKEFQMLRKNESTINKIMKAIQNRQRFIESLNSLIDKQQKDEKQIFEVVDNYRTSTLAVVQEILKWKESWQAAYMEHFKKNINLQLVYKTHNYLYTLASSVDETIKKFHTQRKNQNKQKQSQPYKQNQYKDQQKIIPLKQSQIQKIEQKKQETLRQQIEISKRTAQQNIQEKIQTKRQKTQKTITQPKEQQKFKDQQKNKNQKEQEQEKSKDKKKQQVGNSKYQTQQNEKQQILLNDPFLISLFAIDKQDKNIILKIRACELLLVQQQFNFLKK